MSPFVRSLLQHRDRCPDQLALVARWRDGRRCALTWRELVEHAGAYGTWLLDSLDASNAEHRVVGYSSDNSAEQVILSIACLMVGAVEVPMDHRLPDARKRYSRQIGGAWINEWPDLGDRRGAIPSSSPFEPQEFHASQPALVMWTSGTHSSGRGVALSQQALFQNAQAKLKAVPQRDSDVRLCSLPLSHAYARTCDFGTWLIAGGCLVVGFGYEAWLEFGPEFQPTIANTVPSLAERLAGDIAGRIGTDNLRLLGCGGAAMDARQFQFWSDRSVTVIQGYGMTECGPVVASASPGNALPGLVGKFVQGWEHRLEGQRLFVRGPAQMLGYWCDARATRERVDEEGWVDTGDLVEIDSQSEQLRILGRADDQIVLSDGHLVNPLPIESAIRNHPAVRYAMVSGAGRRTRAWVELSHAFSPAEVFAELHCQVSDYPKWERPERLDVFPFPLRIETGELSHKGSMKREVIQARLDAHVSSRD